MPKTKKNLKLRDQKPVKDPKGGGHKHHVPRAHLNSAGGGTGADTQKHHHRSHNLN
jgi:hypothetical protein